jgi:hypothetical protein
MEVSQSHVLGLLVLRRFGMRNSPAESSSVPRYSTSLSVCSHSSRARWQRISSAENIRRTSETNEEAPWRKSDAQWRRWRNSSVSLRQQVIGLPPPERRVALLWLGSKLDNVALWESRTGPTLKNRGPSAFSTSSISRQLFERHDGISVPIAAQPVRLPQRPLVLFWATELAEALISSPLARFGLQRGSRGRRSSEVAHRSKPDGLSHPLSGSASAWFSWSCC